jgi:hypothetical protein
MTVDMAVPLPIGPCLGMPKHRSPMFNWSKAAENRKLKSEGYDDYAEREYAGELKEARNNSPPTPAQVAKLAEFDVPKEGVATFGCAHNAIGYLASRMWGRMQIDYTRLVGLASGAICFDAPRGTQPLYESQRPHFVVPIQSALGTCLLPSEEALPHGVSGMYQPDEPERT